MLSQQRGREHAVPRYLAVPILLLTLAIGCSSNPLDMTPRTIEPARAAESPPISQNPAGAVRPLAGHAAAAVFDSGTHQLVVLTPGADATAPTSLALFGPGQASPVSIALPGPATALTGDDRGAVYLSDRGGYFVVGLSAGRVAQVNVAGAQQTDFTAIARRADGRLVLGSADGAVYTLASQPPGGASTAAVDNRSKIFARVDYLATQGNTTVVLDRGQTSVTTIGANGHAEQALRAGEGATTLAPDPLGRGTGRRHSRRRTAGLRCRSVDPSAGPTRCAVRPMGWPVRGNWPG